MYIDLTDCEIISINEIIKETDKAWLIKFDNGFQDWFPKSYCRILNSKLYVPKWLAKSKQLIN